MNNFEISIIVLTKNDPGIVVTLDALPHVRMPAQTEIVVVDASTPENVLKYRSKYPKVTWLPFDASKFHKATFPEQRNYAVAHCTGKYIVFLDCGCVPHVDWLEKTYDILRIPRAIAQSRVISKGRQSVFEIDPKKLAQRIIEQFEGSGIGLGFSRDTFAMIGGFDERFSYGEDVDFSWRGKMLGCKIVQDTQAIVEHDWEDWNKEILRAYKYGASRAKLYKKHTQLWRQLFGRDLDALAYSMFIVGLPITFIFPYYPLILAIPFIKNIRRKPFIVLAKNLVFGTGVICGAVSKGFSV